MENKEVVKHLFEVEKMAAELLDDANIRAEQMVAEARSTAEIKVRAESEKIVEELEKNFQKCRAEADELRAKEIENWKNALQSIPVDKPAAKRLLQKIIFEGA